MEAPLDQIYQSLQKLIGLHRQLLDVVRAEREAIVSADVKQIQDVTLSKQGVLETIRRAESDRLKSTGELATLWKKPMRDLTLTAIIHEVQGHDLKQADQFRSAFNALTILVKRVSEQNDANRSLVDRSLDHINQMKNNVLGSAVPESQTYTQQGKKAHAGGASRLISKEA